MKQIKDLIYLMKRWLLTKILNFKTNYYYKFNIFFVIIFCYNDFFYIKNFKLVKNKK